MPRPFALLKWIAKVVVKQSANLLAASGGVPIPVGDIAAEAWEFWHRESDEQQRRADVEALARVPDKELRQEVGRIVAEEAPNLPGPDQQRLADYLTQVPATVRQSLRRPDDPTGTTVPVALSLNRPDDLLPLLPPRLPRFKAGDRPAGIGDWELVELLGVGGFGEVWKARNPHFDGVPPAALKFCLDPVVRERLLEHEAAVLNQVMRQGRHPGIVPLRHTYLNADPPCLEYEFIDGGDLAGLMAERKEADGLPPEEAALLMLRLAEIVAFAHRLDPPIVHRDLKPANVLIQIRPGKRFTLKVADFGIGGLAADHTISQGRLGTKSDVYETTAVRGAYTPLYASPQQMRGEAPDPRDDVYALGVIWHQLLTGNLTGGAPTGLQWTRGLLERGMSDDQLQLMASCFEPDPDERPDNAGVLAHRLKKSLEANPVSAQPTRQLKRRIGEDSGQRTASERIAQKTSEEARLLRTSLLHEPYNTLLRRQYLAVRTPELRQQDMRRIIAALLPYEFATSLLGLFFAGAAFQLSVEASSEAISQVKYAGWAMMGGAMGGLVSSLCSIRRESRNFGVFAGRILTCVMGAGCYYLLMVLSWRYYESPSWSPQLGYLTMLGIIPGATLVTSALALIHAYYGSEYWSKWIKLGPIPFWKYRSLSLEGAQYIFIPSSTHQQQAGPPQAT
jgi:serine/threonine protein kinase